MPNDIKIFKIQTLKNLSAKEQIEKFCFENDNDVSFEVINDYRIRLTSSAVTVDIYPQKNKYHCITNNKRGTYATLIPFLKANF